jgi:S1-C subfamily serine protease
VLYDRDQRLVVTNAHVVVGLTHLQVRFQNGEKVDAQVLGQDPCDDVAVIRVDHVPSDADALSFGDSARTGPTDTVYALGYPESLQDPDSEKVVVTTGSVEATGVRAEPDHSSPVYVDSIQHSATINHGNSGGPLLDGDGGVIGLNTLSNTGDDTDVVQGQYYAIPSARIEPLLPRLASGQNIGYLGADLWAVEEVDPSDFEDQQSRADAVSHYIDAHHVSGVVVYSNPDKGSPLAPRFDAGDVITSLAGKRISSVSEVCDVLAAAAPHSTLPVKGEYLFDPPAGSTIGDDWQAEITLP